LRDINAAKELDVMLYFQGRDGTPALEAHASLQFKLLNIDARDLNLKYVQQHAAGFANAPAAILAGPELKAWGDEFCK